MKTNVSRYLVKREGCARRSRHRVLSFVSEESAIDRARARFVTRDAQRRANLFHVFTSGRGLLISNRRAIKTRGYNSF